MSGFLDEEAFERRYDFLKEVEEDDVKNLKRAIAARKMKGKRGRRERMTCREIIEGTTVEENKADLANFLQRRSKRVKDGDERNIKREFKKKMTSRIEKGVQKAYFPKKRDWNRMRLEGEFEKLEKEGRVDKVLEAKRKRNFERDEGRVAMGKKRF